MPLEMTYTRGLAVARDFLDKGRYYFSMVQYQKTGLHPPPLPFPLDLLFHSTESRQTWYPRKALIKENLAKYVTRHGDEFPSRTSEITGTAPVASHSRYFWLPH